MERQLELPWEPGAYFEMRSLWRILNQKLTASDLCHRCDMENYLCWDKTRSKSPFRRF